MTNGTKERGQWATRMGFLLACAGSAIGLGNIWKFPYVAGMNGGGFFVAIYLACIALIGIPIMVCEFAIGRSAQRSPVEAFRDLTSRGSVWQLVGWLGILTGFVILSYYSVVAGWTLHYVWLSLTGFGGAEDPEAIAGCFEALYASGGANLLWHAVFMGLTVGIVLGGVKGGIERSARVLMPALFVMILVLLVRAMFMPGFGKAVSFILLPDLSGVKPAAVLEAMGQAFFSLSLGMGAMLTYGSYLSRRADIGKSAVLVSVMDTGVALLAALCMFPILFSYGMSPEAGPGLVFKSMPIVFRQLPAGMVFATVFFLLLVFAAITSAVSLMEVVAAFFIDTLGWDRRRATLIPGLAIFLFGVPSALSGSLLSGLTLPGGRSFFDSMDYLASNWFLPIGGLFVALFVGFRMDPERVRREFEEGSAYARWFPVWIRCVRYVCPLAVAAVFVYGLVK
ncbi:MAG: sodium-dependent transporter [Elusimicrobiota bacterium]